MSLFYQNAESQVYLQNLIGENPKTRNNAIEIIKRWLLQQPHLPDTWDEHCLGQYIRGCLYSLEKCKRKLDMYFTVRGAIPEFFTDRDINKPEMLALWEIADLVLLPHLGPKGQRIFIGRASMPDFDTPNIVDFFKLICMIGDLRLRMEDLVVDTYIFDVNFPLAKHFLNVIKVNPMLFKKFFMCIEDAYPVVIKEVHIISAPAFIEFAIKFFKPFLNEQLRSCIHVHTSVETLYEFVPRELLSEEYGGRNGSIAELKKGWFKVLQENTPWFKEQEKVKADESKRLGKNVYYGEYFLEGSFRSLCID